MGEGLKARLKALEQGRSAQGSDVGVVTYGRDETQEQALERARRAGVTGPVLLVPEVMSYEEWTAMMEQEASRANS